MSHDCLVWHNRYFSRFRYCMYAPRVRVCRPFSDGLSSIHHLLGHHILKKSVWAVSLFTCVGNLLVIVWRSVSSKEDQILSLFVQNLSGKYLAIANCHIQYGPRILQVLILFLSLTIIVATKTVSDFLMGVYLLTIASYDGVFRDKYSFHALEWTGSWKCCLCGFIAMLSSELSVLVLTLITIERHRCICGVFLTVSLSSARLNLLLIWSTAFFIAMLPIFLSQGSYYGSSGLCFPLYIDEPYSKGETMSDKWTSCIRLRSLEKSFSVISKIEKGHLRFSSRLKLTGWLFSAVVLIGVNFTAVILMIILYSRMFLTIKNDRKMSRPALDKKKHEDVILALRFFAIVLTDCLCWLPIVVIKVIAFIPDVKISREYRIIILFNSFQNLFIVTFLKLWWNSDNECLVGRVCASYQLGFEPSNLYDRSSNRSSSQAIQALSKDFWRLEKENYKNTSRCERCFQWRWVLGRISVMSSSREASSSSRTSKWKSSRKIVIRLK